MTNRVVVVAGPTASGKTAYGIEFALKYNGEIVSADSMQIYKNMDIGTAKASLSEQEAVRHHMIDIVSPCDNYSVSEYVDAASRCVDDILSRNKVPIIVGGTGLYIDSLISGRSFGDRSDDPDLRSNLCLKYDTVGGMAMLNELATFDPDRALRLSANDKKRIVRAFEVYLLTGKTITQHDIETQQTPARYSAEYHILGMNDREVLYDRINQRVDNMISTGLVDEVRALMEYVPISCTSMQAIGYKEIVEHLQGIISLNDAIDQIKQSSRRYAKRQITWFKKYVRNY